jgi:catechol 2,3-dioxygenase-like lactoylglutathione lyase family enzyme
VATVRYLVKDVDVAIAFYAEVGFELTDRWNPQLAVMKLGDLTLYVSGPDTPTAKALPDGSQPQPGGWNRFVIHVPSMDDALSKLKAKGVRFRSEPIQGTGGRHVLCNDPSGNPIELFETNNVYGRQSKLTKADR